MYAYCSSVYAAVIYSVLTATVYIYYSIHTTVYMLLQHTGHTKHILKARLTIYYTLPYTLSVYPLNSKLQSLSTGLAHKALA